MTGSANPLMLLTYPAEIASDAVTITFKQSISATEGLRTRDVQQDADVHALDDDAVSAAEPRRST